MCCAWRPQPKIQDSEQRGHRKENQETFPVGKGERKGKTRNEDKSIQDPAGPPWDGGQGPSDTVVAKRIQKATTPGGAGGGDASREAPGTSRRSNTSARQASSRAMAQAGSGMPSRPSTLQKRRQWLCHARLHRCLLQTGATCEASTGNVGDNRKATTTNRLGGPQVPADAAKNASWLVRDCRSWARTKASEPSGTPSTTNPCVSGGREPAPTQHDWSGKPGWPRLGTPPSCVPHTCLSLVELDVAVLCEEASQHPEGWPCPLRSCERTRVIKEGSYAFACWHARNAGCCPSECKAGISGSPCSPLSAWSTRCATPPASCHAYSGGSE